MPDLFVSPDDKLHSADPPVLPEKHEIGGHTHSPLAAFCLYPDDIDFETREDKEKIILMLRKHIATNIGWVITVIVLLAIPTIANIFGFFSTLPVGYGLVITLAWYLVTMAYALESFLNWYFDVYFVTTMRIVDVIFRDMVNKKVSDAEVTKIQDVSYTSSGFFGAMFNFGNVFIQTAAEEQEFKFAKVPYPDKVAKILDDFMVKEK